MGSRKSLTVWWYRDRSIGIHSHVDCIAGDGNCDRVAIASDIHDRDINKRREFRHHSRMSKIATSMIPGFGIRGGRVVLRTMADLLEEGA